MGHRIHCGPFIVQCRVAPRAVALQAEVIQAVAPRLGVIASRRVGNAVKRNYGKRIFRELFRQHAAELPQGSELVIVLRSGFDRYGYGDLEARLLRACRTFRKMQEAGELKTSE